MGNKNNVIKYYVILVIFTIIFFVGMALLFVKYQDLSKQYHNSNISTRLEMMEVTEYVIGNGSLINDLTFDNDYEEEFDEYWNLARLQRSYVGARCGYKTSDAIARLNDYISSTQNDQRKKFAQDRLDILLAN